MVKFEDKGNVIYSFSATHPPAAEIGPGEILVVETADCFNGQIHSANQPLADLDLSKLNPATGPFFVKGAEPGDVLAVEILAVKPAGQGVAMVKPGDGIMGQEIPGPVIEIVEVSETAVTFANGISVPVQPMIGVVGVAPPTGSISCRVPGLHGGNLDTREIRPGAKVMLPVFHPGALMAIGDVHAVMGDGEVGGTGIEVAAEVKLRVEVLKDRHLDGPQVVTEGGLLLIRSGETLDQAVTDVTAAAIREIQRLTGLTLAQASILASSCCHLQISQVVNPLVTVKMLIPTCIKKESGV